MTIPRPRRPALLVAVMVVAYAIAFSVLSVLRHRGFFTARYDLGNMTQAVWSASRGELFTVTGPAGEEVSRLGSHVDPILGLFAPLWRLWPSPEMLLVVQSLAVASAAIPAYLLARRWIGDERLAVTFAAVTLLYPALQWATLFDFHAVTLAGPLLLWCIWAATEGRYATLAILATLAALTKEQVGLSLAVLGLWMAVSLGRRRAGAILAAASLAWTAVAVWVIIPRYNTSTGHALQARYGELGSDAGDVLRTLVTRPWDAAEVAATADGGKYVLVLVLPLLGLSLFAPLLAAGALPDLLLNLLSSRAEQHQIQYHYAAVIAPFLIAAAIRGTARLRRGGRPEWLRGIVSRPWPLPAALLAAVLVAGYLVGPLPFWQHVPGGSRMKAEQYTVSDRAHLLRDAVDRIPPDASVSAGNRLGGHLSDRRRILVFPEIGGADFVVLDLQRPDIADEVDPVTYAARVTKLRADEDYVVMSEDDDIVIFRRRPATS